MNNFLLTYHFLILINSRVWSFFLFIAVLLIQGLIPFTYSNGQNYRGAIAIDDKKNDIRTSYAFIIGISDYKNIPDLYYADRDAIAFNEYINTQLRDTGYAQNVMLFLNQQATKTNILDAMTSFLDKPKKGDRVYFYFAGHGDIEDRTQSENGLLLLYGAPEKNYFGLNDDVLQINQIAEYFGKLTTKGIELIYVIDACHSGKLVGGASGKLQTFNAIQASLSTDATLMLSCESNQLALEGIEWGGGHGIFSYYLQEGLSGMVDIDRDNSISLLELESYVKKKTYLESETKQTPVFRGNQNNILTFISDTQWNSINEKLKQKYSEYSLINYKGYEINYIEKSDTLSRTVYQEFLEYLYAGLLLSPTKHNAMSAFRYFMNTNHDNYLCTIMRRKLITKLNIKFDSILRPLLENKKPVWPKNLLIEARIEMDSCLQLLSQKHYLYSHILSRKYFLDALICSYGININNYGLLDASNLTKCIGILHIAKQLEPNAAYIYYALGRLHQTMLQSDSSLLYLEKFATLLPNSALAHNMLGISYGDMNLFLKSKNEFNFAIHLDSTFKESYANLIYIYTKINQADSALYIARIGLRINPQFIGLRNNLADLYLRLDSLEEAKVIIDSTLRMDSSNLGTLMLNGQYWYKLGHFESAQKMFLAVLKLKPDYQTAGLFNVLTLKSERKYSELMKFLKQMIEMDSTNLSFNFELAVCYNMTQQFDKAEVLFAKIIQLGKDHPEKFELLGDVYYFYLNQPEQSEKCYFQALQADSFNIELLSKLSVNLIHLGKYDSLPLLLHLLDKYPNNTIYREYYNMALLVAKGQINIAEPLIDKLIQANHELRWRIFKDPLMNTLVSVPEIKSKLTM